MLESGRTYTQLNSSYRYTFNGKEKDNDIENGAQDYGMRIYDSRVARFLSVDPITKKYPDLTPYQFASNRPIDGIDLDGLEYATFTIYIDADHNVTKISVVKDYELKNKNTRGPGIQYVLKDAKTGEFMGSNFVKNMYGIYQGSTNPQLPYIGKNYNDVHDDYSLAPIDETDASAKQHDLDYDNQHIAGLWGVLSNKSSKANKDYIKRADIIREKYKKGKNDNVTGKPVTKAAKEAAEFGEKWFNIAEDQKKPVDPNNKHPQPMMDTHDPGVGGVP
jgi:RHS repeat-associated protein